MRALTFSESVRRWLAAGAGAIAVLALLAWLVFEAIPDLFAPTEGLTGEPRARARSDASTTALQLLGGTVLVAGAVLSALTLRTNRQGQITERFTRAIDQLGSGNTAVCLGGIYALERIARDSKRDHGPIMEVLTAYVRTTSPAPPPEAPRAPDSERDPAAVQAIVAVLSRRVQAHEPEGTPPIVLSGTNLRGVKLTSGHLEDVVLNGADLGGAALSGVDLERAVLIGARLEKTTLGLDPDDPEAGARLDGAYLTNARLDDADLCGVRLRGALLHDADLARADLSGADLTDAELHGADLSTARLRGTRLQGATFDSRTSWPDHFDPKAAGAASFDDWLA